MKKLLNKKGFTLIELIVVIAILAILALILIPSLLNYIDSANKAKDEANARSIYTAVMLKVSTDVAVVDADLTLGDTVCEIEEVADSPLTASNLGDRFTCTGKGDVALDLDFLE